MQHACGGCATRRERENGAIHTWRAASSRVAINKHNGCITSLYDKRDKFESLAGKGCGNQLQFFKDTPKD